MSESSLCAYFSGKKQKPEIREGLQRKKLMLEMCEQASNFSGGLPKRNRVFFRITALKSGPPKRKFNAFWGFWRNANSEMRNRLDSAAFF